MPTETMRSNWPSSMAIIDELELDVIGDAGSLGPLARDLQLVLRQGHAEHIDACDLVQVQRHSAPAATDVEHPLTRLERELGGDMGLLVELRLLQAILGIGEVSAAVLFVLVEEEFVKLVAEVVMVGDVLARALEVVRVEDPCAGSSRPSSTASCGPCPCLPSGSRRRSSA